MSAISDIRHRHLLFQYRKKICRTENCHSDIGRVPILTSESIPISTSESIPISDIQRIFITSARFKRKTLVFTSERLTFLSLCWSVKLRMSDIRYRIKVYSDIRYNVRLRSLQSDIRSSNIKLSLISLIKEIGVSATAICLFWYQFKPNIGPFRYRIKGIINRILFPISD